MKLGIARRKIDWAPSIDYEVCLNDRVCLDFCKNEVFAWNGQETRVEVVNPLNCVPGCTSCAQLCPAGAIRFPDREELKRTIRQLRAEARAARTSE
jgi:NAD-dependent dihydropyrimidine dehydrogenase PreA subunit